ncbi:MAG: AraC family transcriptional regulator [Anaerolineae bacterium]|nr:AraC family transcriptional regulator [Anaerolineae bacterium]
MSPFISQKFDPTPALQQHVKCFWTLEADESAQNSLPVFPDTNVELIITCGAPYVYSDSSGTLHQLPRVILSGLHNRPQYPHVLGDCRFVAVRLYPWAVRSLTDLPAYIDNLPYIPLSARWQDFARTLVWTFDQRGHQAAVDCLQQFVLDSRHDQPTAVPIQNAGAALDASGGQVDMPTLATRAHLSLRQFERQFKHWTGILPKAYARLIRHESARASLYRDPAQSMAAVALDHGYTDQAHFIHEFKTFTGYTPGEFASVLRSSPIAS